MDGKRKAADGRTVISADELRQDIEWFSNALSAIHPAEIPLLPLRSITDRLEALSESLVRPMTLVEFYLAFAPAANALGDEHTGVPLPAGLLKQHFAAGGAAFPCTVAWHGDLLFVREAGCAAPLLGPGTRIHAVNGIQAGDLRAALSALFPGRTERQRETYAGQYFAEAMALRYHWRGANPFTVSCSTGGAPPVSVQVPGISSPPRIVPFRYARIAADTLLFTFSSFTDERGEFPRFLREMFESIEEEGIQNLVIDLRGNRGGNTFMGDRLLRSLVTEPFSQFHRIDTLVSGQARRRFLSEVPPAARWLPVQYLHPSLRHLWKGKIGAYTTSQFRPRRKAGPGPRFSGNLSVLVGPGSMSSSVLLASTIQKLRRGMVIGEPTGGTDTMYGNMADYPLPRTGLPVEIPCSVLYGNSSGPVIPDHEVSASAESLSEGRDEVLEAAVRLTRKERS